MWEKRRGRSLAGARRWRVHGGGQAYRAPEVHVFVMTGRDLQRRSDTGSQYCVMGHESGSLFPWIESPGECRVIWGASRRPRGDFLTPNIAYDITAQTKGFSWP